MEKKAEKETILNMFGSRRIVADLKDVIELKRRGAAACYRLSDKKTDEREKAFWEAKGDAELDLADELEMIVDKYRII